ncbi:MAG: hypothetical protein ACXVQ3_10335 [Gaiellaceae bacterium]
MGNHAVVTEICQCAVPVPVVKAEWKGAARTVCARCERPIRIEFGSR